MNVDPPCKRCYRRRITGIGGMLDDSQCQCSIHNAGIKVEVAKSCCEAFAERTLACPRRPIDRDHGGLIYDHRIKLHSKCSDIVAILAREALLMQ